MSAPPESGAYLKRRRSPRFPFDSLVRLAAHDIGEKSPLWGRSTDLCREGIGVTVITGQLRAGEVIAMQIPLPSAESIAIQASVRYCKEGHCGFEFVDLCDSEREAIRAACERLTSGPGAGS